MFTFKSEIVKYKNWRNRVRVLFLIQFMFGYFIRENLYYNFQLIKNKRNSDFLLQISCSKNIREQLFCTHI